MFSHDQSNMNSTTETAGGSRRGERRAERRARRETTLAKRRRSLFCEKLETRDLLAGDLQLAPMSMMMAPPNAPPTEITLSEVSIPETQLAGSKVGDLAAVDPDFADVHAFELVAGPGDADNARFAIVGDDLVTTGPLDFETQNFFQIRVRATDSGGAEFEQTLLVNVININEAPTDVTLWPPFVLENSPAGTVVGNLTAIDQDLGDTHAFTLVPGAGDGGNASFAIVGNQLRVAAPIDFETVGPTLSVRVRATDASGLFVEKALTVFVLDTNEAPIPAPADPANIPPTDITLSNISVPETLPAGSLVGNLAAVDPNIGDTHTFAFVGGMGADDNGSFTIVGNQLFTATPLDFETQNLYKIRVQATDEAGATFEKALAVNVININEAPTDLALSDTNVDENSPLGTVVGTFTTIDQDIGDMHVYSLVAGAGDDDNTGFTIVGNQLRTNTPLNFEVKSSYSVRVRTTDASGLFVEEVFTITVNDIAEAPPVLGNTPPTQITLSEISIPETAPAGSVVGNLAAIDPDFGDVQSFELVAGPGDVDNGSFMIVNNQLVTTGPLDFETQDVYQIRVRATDTAGNEFEQVLLVNVININEAPTDVTLGPPFVLENAPAGTVVGNLTAIDPDVGDTHTFTLVGGAGSTGNAFFTIVGNQLRVAVSPDFETVGPTLSVRVRATDASGLFVEKVLTVFVLDTNEAPIPAPADPANVPPTDVTLSNISVPETAPAGTLVGNLAAIDPNFGDTHTFMLIAGQGSDDNGSFTIVGNQLFTATPLDFEMQSLYTIRVQATDDAGATFEKSLLVKVVNINEAPTGVTLSETNVDENSPLGTVVGTFAAVDQDAGDTHVFTLVDGPGSTDNGAFLIVGNQLRTNAPLDFETRSTYSIRVRATDASGLSFEQVFTIDVNDLGGMALAVDSIFGAPGGFGSLWD